MGTTMIAVISFPQPAAFALAEELHAAWPESSIARHARYTNCFQPPEALAFALDHDQAVVVASPTHVLSLLNSGHVRIPDGKDLLCVDPNRRWVIQLAGGAKAAELAREVQAVLGVTPVLDERVPHPLDPLDVLTPHAVRHYRANYGATVRAVADGEPVRLVTDVAYPLPALPPNVSPDAPGDAPVLRVTDFDDPGDGDLLIVPRTLILGIGASSSADPTEAMPLLMATLKATGYLRDAIGRIATVEGKGDHPVVSWVSRCLNVPVEEHPAQELARLTVPNPSEAAAEAVGTPSVAEAAALASSGGGRLLVPKRKSAGTTIAIARAAVRGRLATIGLGPGEHDLLVPRALAELRRASAVVGRPEAVEAVASLLRPGTRQVCLPDPGPIRTPRGEVLDRPGVATDRAGAVLDPAGAAATLATHGHAVALVALGDGSGLAVPPGPYDLHHVPGLPVL
ncbi:cobalamin biosynthesis protein [Streptomyces sp. NRRL WC-3742]|uniref:cobalamin biosynthesis protein n=1 Tax=Streptomyces sp. NRRL WC-3742 TaxID=1463934 RepID=UPI000AC4B01D|nr:cobalamin biosynthesis protein [Streptomyces sp. NRRL WC-3742]